MMKRSAQRLEAVLCAWCRVQPLLVPQGIRLSRKDWLCLLHSARREGVAGLVYRASGRDPLGMNAPAGARATLRQTMLAQAAVWLREEAVLGEVLDALASCRIRPVLLRGLALVTDLYGDGSLRPQVDHDLLVGPEEMKKARDALLSIGFRSSPGGAGPLLRGSSVIDLHSDPYDRERVPSRAMVIHAAASGVRARAVKRHVAGREVDFPCPEDRLLLLAAHLVKHAFDRLIRLVDVAECWRAGGFEPRELVRQAHSEGTADALFYALAAARTRLGAEVSTQLLERLAPGRRPVVDRAFGRVLAGRPSPYFGEWLLLAQLPGLRAQMRAAGEMLQPKEIRERSRSRGSSWGTLLPLRIARLAARGAIGLVGSLASRPLDRH